MCGFIEGPEVNIASAKYNSKTINGSNPSVLLNGDVTNYSGADGRLY